MQIARVTGTLVATQKNRKLEGAKLLFVQPLTLEDTPRGPELLAVDGVGAGVHEKVLIVLRAAQRAMPSARKPRRSMPRSSVSSIQWIWDERLRPARSGSERARGDPRAS